jgi:hypothetical protein
MLDAVRLLTTQGLNEKSPAKFAIALIVFGPLERGRIVTSGGWELNAGAALRTPLFNPEVALLLIGSLCEIDTHKQLG